MCGILGIIGNTKSFSQSSIDAMLLSLAKRGPDEKGTLSFPRCVLGQTRLSIIDLSSGHQPMKDNTRDHAITFNGEIYNYLELKSSLIEKGHKFSTNSDTEVILKAYAEYGEECPKYLDGMFAFAIWDNEKNILFMARDRFGKKPLYYAFDDEKNFIFASEIKAILASGKIKGILDPEAIDNYLALMYVPSVKTVYKNIFTLAPAESATYQNGEFSKKKYWELIYSPITISYNEAKEEVRRLFTEAVKKRMIADVEIGSFLSGGVDSTLVTAYAQKYLKQPIKTFSLGYGNLVSELPYAKAAADKISTDHHTLEADENLIESLTEVLAYFDEPHADSSDFPHSLLAKFTASKVKVALSGDGADELFYGYGWYTRHRNLSYKAHTFEKLFLNPFQGHIRNISIFSESERKKLWGKKNYVNGFVPDDIAESHLGSMEKINLFDLTAYLPGQLLAKADRMSMMHSLEVRSPFLDYHLAEFVFSLPEEQKLGKIILKDLLGEFMPPEFVHRRKQGFGAPVGKWMERPEVQNFIKETFLKKEAHVYELLDKKEVIKILTAFMENKPGFQSYKIWMLLCLELWLETRKE
jgi:asparagine synthase (glutamine-hydrolysing)